MKLVRRSTFNRMKLRLGRLYGRDRAEQLADRLYMLIGRYGVSTTNIESRAAARNRWSHRDAVLITYGDMVTRKGEWPLQTLKNFCDRRLRGAVNIIHILPFCPSSSDAGFSVINYREVDEELGGWPEIERISRDYNLMVDLVLNHCSRESEWFKDYVNGIAPMTDYFQEGNPEDDLSAVVRPRPWPLLSPTETSRGVRHVWTTFSADQVDLNWQSPDILFEFLDIFLAYIAKGVRMVRLDAVAYLWKRVGTSCIHQPETHEVVKLLRDVLLTVAPELILLTETNVPHVENVSYFGRGDEAHMVYQFALPPLILHGLLREDSGPIRSWAHSLTDPPKGCTYLNFTASHDGIGVRPLEGLVAPGELEWLVEQATQRGGLVNYRSMPDGSKKPYELNITYRDALSDPDDPDLGLRRFLCSQAVMLSLRGMPAVYFNSVVGGRNWDEGPKREGGENRDINRYRWTWTELEEKLDDVESDQSWINNVYTSMLRTRAANASFHPDAPQEVLETGNDLFAFVRRSLDGRQRVACCFNFSAQEVRAPLSLVADQLGGAATFRNLLSGGELTLDGDHFVLGPYDAAWVVGE